MSPETSSAVATLQVENDTVRVTRWDFPERGSNTGWHKHAFPYVVVPLFDGCLDISTANEPSTRVELFAGQSYARPAGIEHDVANGLDGPFAFVEIEIFGGDTSDDQTRQSFLYPM